MHLVPRGMPEVRVPSPLSPAPLTGALVPSHFLWSMKWPHLRSWNGSHAVTQLWEGLLLVIL